MKKSRSKKGKEPANEKGDKKTKYASETIRVSAIPYYESGMVRYKFILSGRPPAPLSKGQGEHVTAFGLVERGITRHLTEVEISKEEDLGEIRQRREKINKYVLAALAIDSSTRKDFRNNLLHMPQQSYNAQRVSKGDIRKGTKTVQTLANNTKEIEFFFDDLNKLDLVLSQNIILG